MVDLILALTLGSIAIILYLTIDNLFFIGAPKTYARKKRKQVIAFSGK